MLNIAFEVPENFDLDKLKEEIKYLEIELEETPGSFPRIITAVASHPEKFYQLGGVVAVQRMILQNV